MFFSLEDSLDQRHPLYILANRVDWAMFDREFSSLYSQDNGAPAKPIRLMVGLLILKHVRNLSDESVVEQWSENNYYQYFCGELEFVPKYPCASSELVHFRHRIGESGVELILKESIRINGKDGDEGSISADTTVQEKNITYPTDNKLHRKIISQCKGIAKTEGIELRQSYTHTLKRLLPDQRFGSHPKNRKKAAKANRKVKTIAGRLVRELERKLPASHPHRQSLALFSQVLKQQRNSKHKIYSLHEPQVHCISKGKEHKKYEFGNKVSILYTQTTGVIVGALAFGNEYDGHTLDKALEQYERLKGKRPKNLYADRGYKGRSQIEETQILIPKPFSKKLYQYQQQKRRKAHKRRAAIEPIIGHLKTDHRLSRNFYKGDFGDAINVMLAAAAFNFKRVMNKYKQKIAYIILRIQTILLSEKLKAAF
ncbi:IS5 family transposase [Parabacteroides sp. PF5-5]|nr:IS5 family transposase [Parabacteroides sp. PH5-39]MDH6318011.1 IS5 family transposase [Parabacteroides sp. PF5-13]MDH6321739.1 IS5 family transposase [Parabacteroides sp. PH5-13]MDH6325472.1 IS5 family transposase [Parabacteroides sp. PH5-8]MDH6329200.1 IS5 family transposase [Parabacteroides sp. PH5-41]MDH6337001.1 IS5 family transposase [Parabacteroides sp. PF5-5]MDH6363024.1 IS5 family transposase [Parabacteroides sp. PH5-16]MDH6378693.1 IS5 family transposase [Parabacteroides sp. PH5